MRTNVLPASAIDLDTVASILADVHGAPDSGAALLRHAAPAGTDLPTHPFQASRTRGDWIGRPGTASTGVLLYLHARRFQFDEPPGVLAGRLAETTRLPVLLVRYRLAPGDPYPAALDDVLDAYQELLDQGIRPERIVFIGHSAGATLTLSALLALHQAGRPMPAGAVAISLLIACGDSEMLRDDATRFAAAAAGGGADVELTIFLGMPHGFPLLALEAARILLDRVAEFTTSRLTGMSGPADATGIAK